MVDFGGTKMDVNSRLLKDRIIMIGKQVDDNMANVVVAQLLYLANEVHLHRTMCAVVGFRALVDRHNCLLFSFFHARTRRPT